MTRPDARPQELLADEDLLLPDLADLAGWHGEIEVRQHALADVYHDTAGGDLAAGGMSLRRRSGDLGTGWALGLPSGSAPEVTSGAKTQTPPAALASVALGLTRGNSLRPVAELSTQQTLTRLVGRDGRLQAEVVDERVSSTALGGAGRLDHWRTLTVRPGDSDDADLDAIGARLRKVGARSAEPSDPLARALGATAAAAPPPPQTVGDLVGRYVSEQCEQITHGDLALRLGEPQVHSTRVAIRRLRSTLRIYADLLDPEPSRRLEDELVWWAGLLGEVRDREVLAARLAEQVAALPAELVLGPVAADVAATLSQERAEHLRRVTAELAGPRLLALLEALARWRTEPPLLERASAPVDAVRDYVRAADKKARRRLRHAGREPEGPEQEEQLHRARKAAKRSRYAAELAEPVWPGAERRVRRAKEVQTVLGEHQDSVVTGAFLLRAGAAAGTRRGRNGFTYGLLLGAERERAARARRLVSTLNP
jgi:CHAD domain-containing protein